MDPGRRRHRDRRHFRSRAGSSSATSSSPKCRKRAASSARARKRRWSNRSRPRRDVYAPVSGEVIEGNQAVADDPALINSDPEGEGWFFKLKLDNPGELDGLMDEGAYRDWVKTL